MSFDTPFAFLLVGWSLGMTSSIVFHFCFLITSGGYKSFVESWGND